MDAFEAVDAPVRQVELFEDRAAVTREVTLSGPGRHRLRIGPVSPVVSDRSLTFPGAAGADPADAPTIEEVRIERVDSVVVDRDPELQAQVEGRWRAAQEEAAALSDAHQRALDRAERAEAALDAAQAATPRALLEQDAPVAWIEMVTELGEALTEARQDEDRRRRALQRQQEEVARLERQRLAGQQGRSTVQGFIVLSLVAKAAGPLTLRYVVPCAVWRPAHRAALTTGAPSKVAWELTAVCWNATGEDWADVPLVCSTARPGDLAAPPVLEDDRLHAQRRDREVVVEAREEEIRVAREKAPRAADSAPGVDDGGEVRVYRAAAPATLPSDGRPVTVRLDAWTAEAEARWLALPEQAGTAVLRTVQENAGSRPILAGPVELVRDGTVIGVGRVPLVAAGASFPLGFGSHDGVRIRRKREIHSDRTAITGRQWRTIEVEIHVALFGAEACEVEVRERVPTSELKEIRISAPTAEPPLDAAMDDDGFCRWTLPLQPGETRELKLTYTVDAASNVKLPF
ncbi:MAG: mucoidy inhibitor MuiA family protein [Myxococcota bacterium]